MPYNARVPAADRDHRAFDLQLIILPAVHAFLFILAGLVSLWSPFGLSPVFCVDLPISLPLVAREDLRTVLLVAILGTGWWYFIGRIGWLSRRGRISTLGSMLNALVIVFVCGIGTIAIVGQFSQSFHDERFSLAVIGLYALAGMLLLGGWFTALTCAMAALRIKNL